jgi:hypothetical protein
VKDSVAAAKTASSILWLEFGFWGVASRVERAFSRPFVFGARKAYEIWLSDFGG